jgi:hypothetical protein
LQEDSLKSKFADIISATADELSKYRQAIDGNSSADACLVAVTAVEGAIESATISLRWTRMRGKASIMNLDPLMVLDQQQKVPYQIVKTRTTHEASVSIIEWGGMYSLCFLVPSITRGALVLAER